MGGRLGELSSQSMRRTSLVTFVVLAFCVPTQAAESDGKIADRAPCVPATYEEALAASRERAGADFDESAFRRVFPVERWRELLDGREVRCERIRYWSEGLRVVGFFVRPTKIEPGQRLPAVIFNRGGNREFGAIDFRTLRLLTSLAARGYVVLASQYRGNDGGEGAEEFGGAEVADVLNLLKVIDGLPEADGERVGLYGWSRGGLMTYLALAQTDRIRAAVVGAGPTDSFEVVRLRPEMESGVYAQLIPGWKENREQELAKRSPIRWAERLNPATPILLLHGTADWRVSPRDSIRMAEALYGLKRPFRLILYEGGDHGLSEFREEVDRAVYEWLDRYVRDRQQWPSLEPHGR